MTTAVSTRRPFTFGSGLLIGSLCLLSPAAWADPVRNRNLGSEQACTARRGGHRHDKKPSTGAPAASPRWWKSRENCRPSRRQRQRLKTPLPAQATPRACPPDPACSSKAKAPSRSPTRCERERRQRRHRLRRLRLLRDPRVRLALERARPHRRPARAGVHLLPALQRPPGRGAEGAGQLPPRRQPARGRRPARPEAAAGEDASRTRRWATAATGRSRRRSTRTPRPRDGRLAVRVNATWQGTDGYRDLPDGSIKGLNPTLTWRPDAKTRLFLDYEIREERVAARHRHPVRRGVGGGARPGPADDLLPDALRRLDAGRPALPLRGRAAPRRLARPAQPALLHRARVGLGRHAGERGVPLPGRPHLRGPHPRPPRRPPAAPRRPAGARRPRSPPAR